MSDYGPVTAEQNALFAEGLQHMRDVWLEVRRCPPFVVRFRDRAADFAPEHIGQLRQLGNLVAPWIELMGFDRWLGHVVEDEIRA